MDLMKFWCDVCHNLSWGLAFSRVWTVLEAPKSCHTCTSPRIYFVKKHALELLHDFEPFDSSLRYMYNVLGSFQRPHGYSTSLALEARVGPGSLCMPALAFRNQQKHNKSLEQGTEVGVSSGKLYVIELKPLHLLSSSCRPRIYVQPNWDNSHLHHPQEQSTSTRMKK